MGHHCSDASGCRCSCREREEGGVPGETGGKRSAVDRSLGHWPATRSRGYGDEMTRKICVVVATLLAAACARQMRSPSGFQYSSDAAAIKATLDTTAAGWNRGELSVYLSAYADTATAMGSTGLVRGVRGLEGHMPAGFWRPGRPIQLFTHAPLATPPTR